MRKVKKLIPVLGLIFAFSSIATVTSESNLTDQQVKGSELMACWLGCIGKGGLEPPVA